MNKKIAFSFLTSVVLGMTFLNLSPGLARLIDLYQVSYIGISVLAGALLWSHALIQTPAGMITDRIGIRRTLIIGTGLLSCGNLLPSVLPYFGLAILGRVVAGFGTGLCFVGSMKLIAINTPPNRTGAYQSFFAAFFSLGNILVYLLVPKLLVFGWQSIYLMPGLSSLVLLIFSLGVDAPTLAPAYTSRTPPALGRILRLRAGWVIGFYHAISWGAMLSLGNWIPSLLVEFWPNTSTTQLAWGGAAVMLISGIGRTSGGLILYRFSSLSTANTSIAILAFLFLLLFIIPVPSVLLVLALLAAYFSSMNFGAVFHLTSTVAEPEYLATLIGFVNSLANVGAMLFILAFGFSKDITGSFKWGFGLMMLLSLLALAIGRNILKKDCSPTFRSSDSRHPQGKWTKHLSQEGR